MTPDALKEALRPLCATVAGLDLTDPGKAEAALNAAHPPASLTAVMQKLVESRVSAGN